MDFFKNMLNTIRDNSSERYQELIPEATDNNIKDIGDVILSNDDLKDEFTGALMKEIAFRQVHAKIWKNPLGILKKGQKPMGDTIEEVFINYAKGDVYDPEGIDLLKRNLPDVKTIYHTKNRKNKYKVTISLDNLKSAFRSYGDLRVFYNNIINTLYNGDNRDEFLLFKQLFKNAIDKKFVKVIPIKDPNESKENAIELIKQIKTVSSLMEFTSTEYNGYLDSQEDDDIPVETFTMVPDQYIIIDTETDTTFDVDVLANAFNLSKQEFLARKIKIDFFPDPNIRVMIVDKDFTQIYDDLYKLVRFENVEGLYENWILHHHETISASCLVNAVAFSIGETEVEA